MILLLKSSSLIRVASMARTASVVYSSSSSSSLELTALSQSVILPPIR